MIEADFFPYVYPAIATSFTAKTFLYGVAIHVGLFLGSLFFSVDLYLAFAIITVLVNIVLQ